ncbi:kinase-like protein [Schizophyllum commune Tattone D]|nr:kinase-like protein [Schizophyllum commune Tattone D]
MGVPPTTWIRGERIGEGDNSRVYIGMIVSTGDIIAVKEVDLRLGGDVPHTAQCNTGGPNHDSSPDDAQYLYELRTIRTKNEVLIDLDHPNVVRYLGVDIVSTALEVILQLFLEYIPGCTLQSALAKHGVLDKHGAFPEATTRSFGKQILAGLDYLHSHGVVHGDLTPRKILLTPTGQCKISSLEYRRTPPPNAITPLVFYMAPELVKDRAKPTAACDIWSVGCVLLEMWTGQRPWAGEEMISVLFKMRTRLVFSLHRSPTAEHSTLIPSNASSPSLMTPLTIFAQLYSGKVPPVPSGVILLDSAEDLRARCFVVDPTARPSAADILRHSYFQDPEGTQGQHEPFPLTDESNQQPSLSPTVQEIWEDLDRHFPGRDLDVPLASVVGAAEMEGDAVGIGGNAPEVRADAQEAGVNGEETEGNAAGGTEELPTGLNESVRANAMRLRAVLAQRPASFWEDNIREIM